MRLARYRHAALLGWAILVNGNACGPSASGPVVSPTQTRLSEIVPVQGTVEGEPPNASAPAAEPPPASATAMSDAPAAPTEAGVRLVAEVKRELGRMKETRYRHTSRIDEDAGVFEFDCSGFVEYALRQAAPAAVAALPLGPTGRVRAEDFVLFFLDVGTRSASPPPAWRRIGRIAELRPGDVIAWLRPADVDNTSTGHVAIVMAPPVPGLVVDRKVNDVGGVAGYEVRVGDSTSSPHANDSRSDGDTGGLGTGTLGLISDGSGAPLAYLWRGTASPRAHATTMAMARVL